MRRKLLAVYCIVSLILPAGCIRSTASEYRKSEARRLYRPTSPSEVAPQVRAVSSLSQQVEIPSPPPADETDGLLGLVEEQPENAAALRRLADSYFNDGHFELALERYQALRRLIGQDADVELAVARIHEKLGRPQLALQHAWLAASHDSKGEALEFLGDLHLRRKDYAKAVKIYQTALRQWAGGPSLLISLGEAHLQLKQWLQARRRFAEALALDGSRRDVQNSLALAEVILNGPEEGMRLLVSRKDGPEAINQLGLSLMQLGRWEDARIAFERALSLKPDYLAARLNFEDADSYMYPPRTVKLPSFSAVPDAAVNLVPRPFDPPRKAWAWNRLIVREPKAPLREPVVETHPVAAAEALSDLPAEPPAAAPEEASGRPADVEPIVFLKDRSENDDGVESRQTKVSLPNFEPLRSEAPPAPEPAEALAEAVVKGVVFVDPDFPPQETATQRTAPNRLKRTPRIIDLSWRDLAEAATRIVYLPSSLELEIEAKPGAFASTKLEAISSTPRILPQPSRSRAESRPSAKRRVVSQSASQGLPPVVFPFMDFGVPLKLRPVPLSRPEATTKEAAAAVGPATNAGKISKKPASPPLSAAPAAVWSSLRETPLPGSVGFLPRPLRCIAVDDRFSTDGCIEPVIAAWKFDSIVLEPRRRQEPIVDPKTASDSTIRPKVGAESGHR